jgi:hypothetical protein
MSGIGTKNAFEATLNHRRFSPDSRRSSWCGDSSRMTDTVDKVGEPSEREIILLS